MKFVFQTTLYGMEINSMGMSIYWVELVDGGNNVAKEAFALVQIKTN